MDRGQLSCRSLFRLAVCASENDRALFRDAPPSAATESRFPVEERFGLYEQSWGCSLLTQFSQGCLLSHLTFRCRQGQQAVPDGRVSSDGHLQ